MVVIANKKVTMRLTDVVATAVADARAPAAALALVYAEQIDESTHVSLGLAAALDQLRILAQMTDVSGETDENMRAYRKIAAALSAVTVASDLGPKLLAALDSLLLTPKARAAAGQAVGDATPASPLQRLRARHDGRHLRAAG
jgi:hypothetical protein